MYIREVLVAQMAELLLSTQENQCDDSMDSELGSRKLFTLSNDSRGQKYLKSTDVN